MNFFEHIWKENIMRINIFEEEVIIRFYEAIFVTQYTGGRYYTNLGQYEFSKESKSFALSTSNMMSNFAVLS